MQRDTDSTDIPTLTHELKLIISPTSVGRGTDSVGEVSVKCRT